MDARTWEWIEKKGSVVDRSEVDGGDGEPRSESNEGLVPWILSYGNDGSQSESVPSKSGSQVER